MTDDKLYFSKAQVVTTDCVGDYYLDVKAIAEVGEGSPLYIYVVVDNAYSNAKYTGSLSKLDIYLITSSGAPAKGGIDVMMIANDLACSNGDMNSLGVVCKVPLPSIGLQDHIGLAYDLNTTIANGTISAYLALE
jgi:hypothetical protein